MANAVELWTRPCDFISKAPSHPHLTPLARAQADSDLPLINLRHEEFRLGDAALKKLFVLMDGTRDHASLLDALMEIMHRTVSAPRAGSGPSAPNPRLKEFLGNVLATLSNQSLFADFLR
jgi:hypothetical protein